MKGAGTSVLLLCFLMSVLLSACGNPASGAANELDGTASLTKYYSNAASAAKFTAPMRPQTCWA